MGGAWTAERLDDLNEGMREGFGRVDAEFAKVDKRFDRVDERFNKVAADIRALRGDVHAEIRALNQTIVRVGGGLMVTMILGFVGVIGGLVGIMVGA